MLNFKMNKNNLENLISKLRDLDATQMWEVIVRKPKSIRSMDQNEYYWEMLTAMGEYFGYDKNDMHRLMAYKFLFEMKEIKNESVGFIRSTSDLNTKEFNEYLDNIKFWSGQYGFNFEEK